MNANLKLCLLILLIISLLFLDKNTLITSLNLSFSNKVISIGKFDFIFTLFCFVAFINAFNLFDGLNCQIGSYIFFILVIFFFFNLNLLILITLFFPLLIFLILNSKGKIFLGNSGSYFLGFIIAYIFIKSYNNFNSLYSDQIFLIMLFPGLDMIRLFFIRIKNKKNPFTPDRNHFHHLLLEKYNYNLTFLIIFMMSIAPYVLGLLINSYIAASLFLLIYFMLMNLLISKNST